MKAEDVNSVIQTGMMAQTSFSQSSISASTTLFHSAVTSNSGGATLTQTSATKPIGSASATTTPSTAAILQKPLLSLLSVLIVALALW
ncbi:hypothetical protein BZG36_04516 [Bifiguratus adelaidae]|uniref:Uncharacterized protein n=1 Tax=Bifiguratus adelaidae TaxID=1938954 RepID=A0A261XX69_9FUNG|nr:hypothetical protein BZG36_04516 [Bifiguratus adelaidae]